MTKDVLLLPNNALIHKNRFVLAVLHKVNFDILNHPQYSSDLTPNYFYLFPKMHGKTFTSDKEVKNLVSAYFSDKIRIDEGIEKLIERSEQCIRRASILFFIFPPFPPFRELRKIFFNILMF